MDQNIAFFYDPTGQKRKNRSKLTMTKHLTPQELSDRWGGAIKITTLRNWRNTGRGPTFIKLGSKAVYPITAVEDYETINLIDRKAA